MLYSFEEWGQLYISSSRHWLLWEKMFHSFVCVWDSLPASSHILSNLDSWRLSGRACQFGSCRNVLLARKVAKKENLLQSQVPEKISKDFDICLWESVEDSMMLRVMTFTFGDLRFVLVFSFLWWERGDLQGWLEEEMSLWHSLAIWQVKQVLSFLPLVGKENLLTSLYSGERLNCPHMWFRI